MKYALALLIVLSGFTQQAHAAERGPCDEERWLRITPTEARDHPNLVPSLIRCAAERFGIDVQTALRVADCESSFWPFAHANGNYGIFQHRGTYWPDRVHAYLKPDWFNDGQWSRLREVPQGPYIARASAILTARMVRSVGWSPWSCY